MIHYISAILLCIALNEFKINLWGAFAARACRRTEKKCAWQGAGHVYQILSLPKTWCVLLLLEKVAFLPFLLLAGKWRVSSRRSLSLL
jgi:hypothetical protein